MSKLVKAKLGRASTVDLRILRLLGKLGGAFGLLRAGLESIETSGGSVEQKLAVLGKALKEFDEGFFSELNELVDQLIAEVSDDKSS